MTAVDDLELVVSEHDKVVNWRLHVLIEAGYGELHGTAVATRTDIDLHYAVELVEAGCDPVVATEILL